MEKDADAFRTISEVAETLDIPPHVLRFWETKFPQIRPLKRGGGRRYYRRSDTDLLRTIRRLLYDDSYTIRGVQRLLKAKGAAAVTMLPPGEIPSPQEQEAMAAFAGDQAVARSDGTDHERLRAAIARIVVEIRSCRIVLDEALRTEGHDPNGLVQA